LTILSVLFSIAVATDEAMQYVSATDAEQSFAATLDMAQQEPGVIRCQNRDVAVLISVQDYARLTQLNLEAFRAEVSCKAQERGLTQEELDELLESPE
jgi:PHD/YefM family antitoxin component YafN of YafNO toxin-antitoxin module